MSTLIVRNATIFDGQSPELIEGGEIVVQHGRILEVNDRPSRGGDSARVIDAGGRFVMPGLIDAHFHAYGADINIRRLDHMPVALRALHAREILEGAARRGFTTVRDAGGADLSLVRATEMGLIRGPRILPAGLAISQTGGHGDFRPAEDAGVCGCAYSGALSAVADGPDEVRRTAREQLRRGATQIKLFLSGGVLSPTDPLWMNGFTDEEISAAVAEARRWRTYVMAHAHTAEAAIRCVRLGVRSIEHATMLTAEAVQVIRDHSAFVVPTLSPVSCFKEAGPSMGLVPEMMVKLIEVERHAMTSCDMLIQAGVEVGLGSDLLGTMMDRQSQELVLRREFSPAIDVLRAATTVNARILGREGELGTIAPGALADLIVVEGNPLQRIEVLTDPARIPFVLREGVVLKNALDA